MSKNRLRLGVKTDTIYGLRDDEIPLTHSKAQDFLIKGRNPLLIIYFINPTNQDDDFEEIFTTDESVGQDFVDEIKLYTELMTRKYNYLVGYSIGFPDKDGASKETIMYTVNKTVNYFDMEHDNESVEE